VSTHSPSDNTFRFDLAAESITLRIRWFGVCVGFALVNLIGADRLHPGASRDVFLLNGILMIGVAYVAMDTYWSYRGKVFLSNWPLAVSLLETVFIGLLCYFDLGQESAFRFYYLLSVVVCAIRYAPVIT
jgi:two-component system, NtrC family, sensor kinase